MSSSASSPANAMPCSSNSGSSSASCSSRSRCGSPVAHECEPFGAAPEERHGQRERRVVGRVEPQLERERRRCRGARRDAGRAASAPPRTSSNPASTQRASRCSSGSSAARGQLRIGRRQPAEKCVERGGLRAAEPDAGLDELRARDLVDELRIELFELAGSRSARGRRVVEPVWVGSSIVAPQNAYHVLPPRASCGWTRPSATERRARSATASTARALSPELAAVRVELEQLRHGQAARFCVPVGDVDLGPRPFSARRRSQRRSRSAR